MEVPQTLLASLLCQKYSLSGCYPATGILIQPIELDDQIQMRHIKIDAPNESFTVIELDLLHEHAFFVVKRGNSGVDYAFLCD